MTKVAEHFEDFKLNRQLLSAVEEMGYRQPTEVQRRVIPIALAGQDLIGIAQTGTGKTAAYLLPLLMKLKYAQGMHPRALVLAPGKELVIQIAENAAMLGKYCDLRIVRLYGGVGPTQQLKDLEAGADLLIATPGRFLELYRREAIYTRDIRTLVLDEADKMMDMGFMPQIRDILEKLPSKRQNCLFSATFGPRIDALAGEFLLFPQRVEVSPQATPAETVEHYFYAVPNFKTKVNLLEHLLGDPAFDRVMVFVKKKETATQLFKFIGRKFGGSVRLIHGNKAQNTRIKAFDDFRKGEIRVLVTTDVSARGLDIPEVSHVVNFDVPLVYEDYVHRIGRTGRTGLSGEAITFANSAEQMHLKEVEKLIRTGIAERPLPEGVAEPFTAKEELIEIARERDRIRRRLDPDFKGAFHRPKLPSSHRRPRKKRPGRP
jgi:ATP-dependent RNA helicase RhlE